MAEEIVTTKQLRSPLFVRLFRDAYLPGAMPITHELRCRAASLVLPSCAVFTGHSAAALYGIPLALPSDPVELIVPEDVHLRSRQGMHVRRVRIMPHEHQVVGDLRVATPLRMTLDLLYNTNLRKSIGVAVGALDSVLHQKLVDHETIRKIVAARHDHGVVRARRAVSLADSRAESVPESVLRVLLAQRGIAATPQVEVWYHNEFVARVDLALDGARIAVEYDGEWHDDPVQSRLDEARRRRLSLAGWETVVVRKNDLQQNPDQIVRTVRAALRAQNARPGLPCAP